MVSPSDSTARAQIRDCALSLFADRGPDAVTVRDVAACADVSPALVLHHFGSKAGLKEAVDTYVVSVFDDLLKRAQEQPEAFATGQPQMVQSFAELFSSSLTTTSPLAAYLRRLLLSGDQAGRELFRTWFGLTRGAVEGLEAAGMARPAADPDARAAFLLVNDLAMILLHDHVGDVLGDDPLSAQGMRRWAATAFDAYANGVFGKEIP